MNYERAIFILDLPKQFDSEALKTQYKKLAKKYHPDRCKLNDASEKFVLISNAYQYLLAHENIKVDDEENNLFLNLSLKMLKSLDIESIYKIKNLIDRWDEFLKKNKTFIERVRTVLCDHIYILNPTIDKLLNKDVFILNHLEDTFYIPLWHEELKYNLENYNLIVKINPILDDHIKIDENNNIQVYLKNIDTTNPEISFLIGDKKFYIQKENYGNNYIFYNQGIPIIKDDIYDCSNLSNIIVYFS